MDIYCKQLFYLLEDIYETIEDPTHWNSVLTQLSSYVNKGKAALTVRDNETGFVDGLDLAITKIVGIENDLIGAYVNEICFYDEWLSFEINHDYSDNPICLFSNYLSKKELIETKFYKNWLQKLEIKDGIALQVFKSDKIRVVLNIFFDDDNESAIEKLCDDIVIVTPHLKRAISLWVSLNTNYYSPKQELRTKFLMNSYGVTARELQIVSSYIRTGHAKITAKEYKIKSDTVHTNVANVRRKMGCSNAQELKLKLLSYSD